MKIIQPNSRTIRVEADSGTRFFLPYRLIWNGHEREPASVVLQKNGSGAKATADVKAFFLFGMVRDTISADAAGITISRSWSVMTPGAVTILLDVEFETPVDPVCLFPGVHSARGRPSSPVSFFGERTSYPSAVVVGLGREAAFIFSRSAFCAGDPSSIGTSTIEAEDEPVRLRVEVRFPGVEQPRARTGPKPGQTSDLDDDGIACSGSLERTHEIFLAFSPRAEILVTAAAVALRRLRAGARPKPAAKLTPGLSALSRAALEALSTHLVEEDGVEGLRELPGSPRLSSSAGLSLAIAMRMLFRGDSKLGEIALRLGDFSLKGQLPSGLFFESYDLDAGEWRALRDSPDGSGPSAAQSARIADLLLQLAGVLEGEGLPFQKYFLAGQRFVDCVVDEKGHLDLPEADDIGKMEVFFPLAQVLDRLGRDRYKKALDAIAHRFSAATWDVFRPPSSRGGRDSDSTTSLLAARLFVEMRERGYRPAESAGTGAPAAKARAVESTRLFASLLVPWIRVHRDEARRQGRPWLDGTLVDSFVRQRLLPAGQETGYLLRRLAALAGRPDLKALLGNLSALCLASGRDLPLGTAFYEHTTEKTGPVDSRRLGSELLYGIKAASRGRPPSLVRRRQARVR